MNDEVHKAFFAKHAKLFGASSGTIPTCGHCGRPVINSPAVYSNGVAFHAECTLGHEPHCGHAYYAVDHVTGEHTCKDCGKLLIDCIGRVMD